MHKALHIREGRLNEATLLNSMLLIKDPFKTQDQVALQRISQSFAERCSRSIAASDPVPRGMCLGVLKAWAALGVTAGDVDVGVVVQALMQGKGPLKGESDPATWLAVIGYADVAGFKQEWAQVVREDKELEAVD